MAWYDEIANTTKGNVQGLVNALSHPIDTAKAQLEKGAPYRQALASALQGDMPGVNQALSKSELTPADFGMMLSTIKGVGKAPFEGVLNLAQQRAALPVSEGGLGLPTTNTAMQRAEAMGYTNPAYHGTNADFNIFNVEGKGKTSGGGAFVTDNPLVAETYVGGVGSGGSIMPLLVRKDNLLDVNARGRNWADIWTDQLSAKSKGKKYSLDDLGLDKYSATTTDELAQIAPELGLKGVNIKNVKDLGPNSHIFRAKEYLSNKYGIVPDETWSNVSGNQFVEARDFMDKLYKSQKSNITALQDPSMIRSTNAAFDPFNRKSSDILAGVGVGFPILSKKDEKKK
jgi:hypothetical protein